MGRGLSSITPQLSFYEWCVVLRWIWVELLIQNTTWPHIMWSTTTRSRGSKSVSGHLSDWNSMCLCQSQRWGLRYLRELLTVCIGLYLLATLASDEAAGHLSTGCTDSQGADHSHQCISASWYRPMHNLGICAHLMLRCWSFLAYTPNWPVTLFLLLLHPPGTLCLLTFNCAKTFSLSNATWKYIYSNSLSPPVLP